MLIVIFLAFAASGAAAMRVGIVGAGPAGLTLANALRTLPGPAIDVTVYDRDSALRTEIGGGLQLSCGAAALAGIGIDVSTRATPLRGVLSRQVGGRELLAVDVQRVMREARGDYIRGEDSPAEAWAAFKAASDLPEDAAFAIMRDELQSLLAAPLPAETLQLGRVVSGVREAAGGAVLSFADGSADEAVDLVVGCDGIGSVVKECCFPGAAPPSYSGVKVLFAVAPGGARPAGSASTFHQWLGDGAYALSASYGAGEAGTRDMLALCYADATPAAENSGWDGSEALRAVCDAKLRVAGMPDEVLAVAAAAERFYESSVFFRSPSLSWASDAGGAVLCGDAAHAMPPFLGQGANQAILDAVRLATELKAVAPAGGGGGGGKHADVKGALKAYQEARWFATARLLANSRILGFLETLSGPGALFRDAFFFTTGKLGIAEKVFLDGAMMKP